MIQEEKQVEGWEPKRHRRDEEELTDAEKQKLKVRNWLNIIFMVVAIAGVAYYMTADKTVGMYIVLTAMAIKMVEASMRMIK